MFLASQQDQQRLSQSQVLLLMYHHRLPSLRTHPAPVPFQGLGLLITTNTVQFQGQTLGLVCLVFLPPSTMCPKGLSQIPHPFSVSLHLLLPHPQPHAIPAYGVGGSRRKVTQIGVLSTQHSSVKQETTLTDAL